MLCAGLLLAAPPEAEAAVPSGPPAVPAAARSDLEERKVAGSNPAADPTVLK